MCFIVILAKAGIQSYHILMDSRFRGNDTFSTFYMTNIINMLEINTLFKFSRI